MDLIGVNGNIENEALTFNEKVRLSIHSLENCKGGDNPWYYDYPEQSGGGLQTLIDAAKKYLNDTTPNREIAYKQQLAVKTHLLNEATKLLARMGDNLKFARDHIVDLELELRDLREELNKPSGE